MEYHSDLSVINWLNVAGSNSQLRRRLQIKDILPDIFPIYTALLPAVGIIEGFPFDKVDLTINTIDQINANATIWKSYGIYSAAHKPKYTPTNFKELASQFHIPYDLQLVDRLEWRKQGFAILSDQSASHLKTFLKNITPTNKLNLYVEDYYRWQGINNLSLGANNVVYRVTIDDFIYFFTQTSFDSTLYLFPDDRSWCLFNAEDCFFPIIGASVEIGTILAAQSTIEIIDLSLESEL